MHEVRLASAWTKLRAHSKSRQAEQRGTNNIRMHTLTDGATHTHTCMPDREGNTSVAMEQESAVCALPPVPIPRRYAVLSACHCLRVCMHTPILVSATPRTSMAHTFWLVGERQTPDVETATASLSRSGRPKRRNGRRWGEPQPLPEPSSSTTARLAASVSFGGQHRSAPMPSDAESAAEAIPLRSDVLLGAIPANRPADATYTPAERYPIGPPREPHRPPPRRSLGGDAPVRARLGGAKRVLSRGRAASINRAKAATSTKARTQRGVRKLCAPEPPPGHAPPNEAASTAKSATRVHRHSPWPTPHPKSGRCAGFQRRCGTHDTNKAARSPHKGYAPENFNGTRTSSLRGGAPDDGQTCYEACLQRRPSRKNTAPYTCERRYAQALPTDTLVKATCRAPCATTHLVHRRRGTHTLEAERCVCRAPTKPKPLQGLACFATTCAAEPRPRTDGHGKRGSPTASRTPRPPKQATRNLVPICM